MTTNQVIALLFPVGVTVGAVLTGWLAKKLWVDRKPEIVGSTHVDEDILSALGEAERAIQKADKGMRVKASEPLPRHLSPQP
ncbi:hypothetical protein ABIB90_006114 [Bradyrhizobium sp. JR4.1]|uniref:hypothetical protein n=1 Tax=unclassified Bradyrhizobium TaxID=2631580 RepID=UPI003392FE83